MFVPKAFEKSLRLLDPTYRVQDTEDHNGYFIVKDIDLTLKAGMENSLSIPDPKLLRVRGPCVIAWVPDLGEGALEHLRMMKMRALEMKIYENPLNELAFWKAQQKRVKEKRMELAVDMVSEGLMEAHKLDRKKSWSYGGSLPEEKTDGQRHHDESETLGLGRGRSREGGE